jgi:spore maturation protein CgeB
MRILFLESHPMWIYGLPNGFLDAGHQVMISGPLTESVLRSVVSLFQPELVVSLGWTEEHTPEKREWVRRYIKEAGIPFVFWATEDPIHTEAFSLPYIRSTEPDLVFTVSPAMVEHYQSLGILAAHLDFGYHPSVHHPTSSAFKYRLAIVANAYPDVLQAHPDLYRIKSMRQLIRPLLKRKIRIDFWGREWGRMDKYLGRSIPRPWIHGYLAYTLANKVYSAADIVLGLQNCEEQLTQRTYEVLASGGVLLTSDTPAVRERFVPGEHLIVSSSSDETRELVNYYLRELAQLERIRQQGMEAVEEHSYVRRALKMVEELQKRGIID